MIDYGLWAECKDEENLFKLKAHFTDLQYTLLNGRTIQFNTGFIENDEARGLGVGSRQVCENGRGTETLQEALDINEVGIFLHYKLRTAPDFRFAHIGWNAENQSNASDLHNWVEILSDGKNHWQGFECIIDDELYRKLGSPIPFWQFRKGYWWQKFRGEKYDPLFSSDQNELRGVCEKLLPDNFDWSKSVRE